MIKMKGRLLVTLPDLPPDSFFDGGEPNSQVAPGDTGRELLHEVKNLASAVKLLTKVVDRQQERQKRYFFGVAVAVVLLGMFAGFSRYLVVQQSQDRIDSNRAACIRDDNRGDLEIEILTASQAQAIKTNPGAQAFYAPRIAEFKALQKDCNALFPLPGTSGWPTFFGNG